MRAWLAHGRNPLGPRGTVQTHTIQILLCPVVRGRVVVEPPPCFIHLGALDDVKLTRRQEGQFLAVTAHSKHPKEAAMFINYFTNSIEANKVLLAERGVPISSVVAGGLKELLTSSQREMFDYMALVETDSSPLRLPDPVKHAEIMDNVYLVEFISPVLYGQMSAEDGVKRYRDLASEILAED